MRACSHLPTTRDSWWETKPVCGGVEAYNERFLHPKHRHSEVPTSFYKCTPCTQVPMGNTVTPKDTSKLRECESRNPPCCKRTQHGATRHSIIQLQRVSGTQGFRMATCYRSETVKRPL